MQNIRVFHVEDYKILRDGLRYMISTQPNIKLVGQAEDANNLVYQLAQNPVDVLILDIYYDASDDSSVRNGIELCPILIKEFPALKIVVHSAFDNTHIVDTIFKAGALAYVSKKSGFDELLKAIEVAATGKHFVCSTTSKKLKNLRSFLLGHDGRLIGHDEIFSLREKEVLPLLGRGKSSKEIASLLNVTMRTVETHRKNMIQKADVKNTAELIVFASKAGLMR